MYFYNIFGWFFTYNSRLYQTDFFSYLCGKILIMKQRRLITLALILVALFFLIFYPNNKKETVPYIQNHGQVFGTYYNIQYSQTDKLDLQNSIDSLLAVFNHSLSVYDPQSIISRVNRNDTVTLDPYFERMYAQAKSVSELTHGAFDITVAPLVNAWGFGFSEKETITPERIDSLLQFTGHWRLYLERHHIVKNDPRIMLDASAIAKGYGCDVVGEFLAANGCENYLVDIGGEIVAHGRNPEGKPWRVGINKPIDDPTNTISEIETVIHIEDACMATSGNYRQFYYQDGKKYAHTIDPRTGYPVTHSLLSATIIATSCMRADALATACMVLGKDEAFALINRLPDTECFLIYADEQGKMQTVYTPGFEKYMK